jgi:putative tricarboxylic transport membrane protein
MLLAGFFMGNVFLLVFGLLAIRVFSRVVKIPVPILAPLILVLCMIGSYSVAGSVLDVIIMFVMGVIGFVMQKHDIPGAPLIIGLILGPMNEMALRQALTGSQGDWMIFVRNPLCMTFLLLTVLSLAFPIIKRHLRSMLKNRPCKGSPI